MAKKEVIIKIVKVVLRSLANSYAFTFTPVAKGSRRFANDVRILMTESDLLRACHLL